MNDAELHESVTRIQQAERSSPLWPALLKHRDADPKLADDAANIVRHCLWLLDDGPVTEEALDGLGFGPCNPYGCREHTVRKNMHWNLDFGYICLAGDDEDCTITITTIGQLRRLLSGLGVEV